jgi:hypothetical protein
MRPWSALDRATLPVVTAAAPSACLSLGFLCSNYVKFPNMFE